MKSPTHLERCIQCPKCSHVTMRMSIPANMVGKEYFCDQCHIYFSVEELVNKWGFDLGDFGDVSFPLSVYTHTHTEYKMWQMPLKADAPVVDKIVATTWFDFDTASSFVIDEPTFKSPSERWEAYQMVDRMFIGIPEWSMESNEVDTGATHH